MAGTSQAGNKLCCHASTSLQAGNRQEERRITALVELGHWFPTYSSPTEQAPSYLLASQSK